MLACECQRYGKKRGRATWGGCWNKCQRHRKEIIELEFAGEQAEATVIEGPAAVAEKRGASFADGLGDELVRESGGEFLCDGASKHLEPGTKTVFAVFECSRAVEEKGVRNFETVEFEERGVFGDTGVIPGARKRLRLAETPPGAAKGQHQAFDVALATEFRDEAATRLDD